MQPFAHVAEQLFDLVIQIDPARTSIERIGENVRGRCRELSSEIDRVLSQVRWPKMEASAERAIREALSSASANLSELSEALSDGERWRQVYAGLSRNYDQLTRTLSAARLSGSGVFRRLSPVNYARNLFHITGGVTGALCYHFLLSRTQAAIVMAIFVVTFTTLEILRRYSARMNDALMRFSFFRRIARAREYYQVNSATYYAYGMLAAVLLFPRQAVEAACFVLAFGDPAASNIGRRFGRVKIFREKSVMGTFAFVIAAFLPLLGYQLLFYGDQPLSQKLLVAGTGAIVGAIVEAFTIRLDDNLTVPLGVAAAIALVV